MSIETVMLFHYWLKNVSQTQYRNTCFQMHCLKEMKLNLQNEVELKWKHLLQNVVLFSPLLSSVLSTLSSSSSLPSLRTASPGNTARWEQQRSFCPREQKASSSSVSYHILRRPLLKKKRKKKPHIISLSRGCVYESERLSEVHQFRLSTGLCNTGRSVCLWSRRSDTPQWSILPSLLKTHNQRLE